MRGLLTALLVLVPTITAFIGGRWSARGVRLTRDERQELKELRSMRHSLSMSVGEYKALGDGYAYVVNDVLKEHFERGSK